MGMELELLEEIYKQGFSGHCFCEHCQTIKAKIEAIMSIYYPKPSLPRQEPKNPVMGLFGRKKEVSVSQSLPEDLIPPQPPRTFSKAL